jgi:hypothetical protein
MSKKFEKRTKQTSFNLSRQVLAGQPEKWHVLELNKVVEIKLKNMANIV